MENKQMNQDELKKEIRHFLQEHNTGSLGTVIGNMPRSSPVMYYVGEGLDTYVVSAGGSKFQAIAENPNVCLLVHTDFLDHRRIKGVQIFGKARAGQAGDPVYEECRAFVPDHILKDDVKVIKVTPQEVVYLNSLIDGDRTKQRLLM